MKKLIVLLSLFTILKIQAFNPDQLAQDRAAIKAITLQDGSQVRHSVWQLKTTYNLLFAQLEMAFEGFPKDKNYLRAIVKHAAEGDFSNIIKKAKCAKEYVARNYHDYFERKKRQAIASGNYDFLLECASPEVPKNASDGSFEFVE